MQISDEYGTELLLRYTEMQRTRDLERRRIINERLAETKDTRRPRGTIRAWLAELFAADAVDSAESVRIPAASARRNAGMSAVPAAHR